MKKSGKFKFRSLIRSVVVDNTHADAEARKKFVDAARLCPKLKGVRCFVMAASIAQAR